MLDSIRRINKKKCSSLLISGVIFLTAIANRFRLHQLSKVEKFVMSYGGLRGAVAFALVLLIDPAVVKYQSMFMTTTIAVVYFTVFFQGITIKPLVKILNVKTAEKRKPTMNERIHERVLGRRTFVYAYFNVSILVRSS